MTRTLLVLTAILVLSLAIIASSQAAVYNVTLSPVGDDGVSGTATTIAGQVMGERPYTNVEMNIRMNTPPPANMVYEAWLIDTDTGFLNSLGIMEGMTFSTRQRLAQFQPGQPYNAIAVSLEPVRDANPAPTTVVSQGILPGTEVAAADFPGRAAVLPPDEALQRQMVMQRYMMPTQEVTQLRMQGWSYPEIAVVANAAVRCNRPVEEVARLRQQGQTWEQIAQACGVTVATLLEPVPIEAVAGYRGELPPEVPPVGVRPGITFYRQYASGRPVVTRQTWESLSRRGYSWQNVAMAANVAARTGEEVPDLLRAMRIQGLTWRSIALDRGLNINEVMDVDAWPFERNSAVITPSVRRAIPPPAPGVPPPPAGATY